MKAPDFSNHPNFCADIFNQSGTDSSADFSNDVDGQYFRVSYRTTLQPYEPADIQKFFRIFKKNIFSENFKDKHSSFTRTHEYFIITLGAIHTPRGRFFLDGPPPTSRDRM